MTPRGSDASLRTKVTMRSTGSMASTRASRENSSAPTPRMRTVNAVSAQLTHQYDDVLERLSGWAAVMYLYSAVVTVFALMSLTATDRLVDMVSISTVRKLGTPLLAFPYDAHPRRTYPSEGRSSRTVSSTRT